LATVVAAKRIRQRNPACNGTGVFPELIPRGWPGDWPSRSEGPIEKRLVERVGKVTGCTFSALERFVPT